MANWGHFWVWNGGGLRVFLEMSLLVYLEVERGGESLETIFTVEAALTGMQLNMLSEVSRLGKCLIALVTLVWSLSCVNSKVVKEVTGFTKFFVAALVRTP